MERGQSCNKLHHKQAGRVSTICLRRFLDNLCPFKNCNRFWRQGDLFAGHFYGRFGNQQGMIIAHAQAGQIRFI